ncbi:MAG: PhzF family phenazine biosynthesis protein [Gemmatimonadaceae bacterium]
MSYVFHTADVFTDHAFGGNQLAVLPDARGLSAEQMMQIAKEFNFSETIFVLPPEDPANTRRVRIFTPGAELPFAGHPTVGAAYVLAITGEIDLDGEETRIVLEEGVGPVPVLIRSREGKPYFTQLTAAKIPELIRNDFSPEAIARGLSLEVGDLDLDSGYSSEVVSAGVPFLIVPLKTVEALGRARLDERAWEAVIMSGGTAEVFIFTEDETSKARDGVRGGDAVLRARMFAPTFGIPEDPATGGACACLGGYLAWRSSVRDGTLRYSVNQGVEMGRPSLLEIETDVERGRVTEVRVGGSSVLMTTGTLHFP